MNIIETTNKDVPFSEYMSDFFQYLKRPIHRYPTLDTIQYSLANLVKGWLVLFIFNMVFFGLLSTVLDMEQYPNMLEDMDTLFTPAMMFLAAVVLAPILEEFMFRFPLKFLKRGFAIWFYIFAIVFGLMHVFNFSELSGSQWLIAPLLVVPQLVLGFYFGFVRMKYSIYHSIAAHAMNNAVPMLIYFASTAMGVEI